MDTRLASLNPGFLTRVEMFLARLMEAKIPVQIINTLRTDAEQAANVASGHSWVKRSKHQDGYAIDICPYSVYDLKGPDKLQWDANDPVWERIGQIGESCGLVWGGRWKVKDLGHFELP